MTKFYFTLYETDECPRGEATEENPKGYIVDFQQFNPSPVATTVSNIAIKPGETSLVTVTLNKPYQNTKNKFITIGFHADGYINKVNVVPQIPTDVVLNSFNTQIFHDARVYYCTTQSSASPNFGRGGFRGYTEASFAWSFINVGHSENNNSEYLTNIIDTKIEQATKPLSDKITSLEQYKLSKTSKISAPTEYHAVVGDTLQLFYNAIISTFSNNYDGLVVTTDKGLTSGKQFVDYFEITPTTSEIGNHTITFTTRNIDGAIIESKTVNLIIDPIPVFNAVKNYNMLIVGDSLTTAGIWCGEGLRRLVGGHGDVVGCKVHIYDTDGELLSDNAFIGSIWLDNNKTKWQLYQRTKYFLYFRLLIGQTLPTELPTAWHCCLDNTELKGAQIRDTSWLYRGPDSFAVPNLAFNTYGHCQASVNGYTVNYEAIGGWTWKMYLEPFLSIRATIQASTKVPHNIDLESTQKSIWIDENGRKWELEDIPSPTKINFNRGPNNDKPVANTPLPTKLTKQSEERTLDVTCSWQTVNPFWNHDTDQIDFKAHAAKYGIDAPDIIVTLLTWNSGGARIDFTANSALAEHEKYCKEFLTKMHTTFPKAKFLILGLQLPSMTGGTGTNYSTSNLYADTIALCQYALLYNSALQKWCVDLNTAWGDNYCMYGDIAGEVDSISNMPWDYKATNLRTNSLEKIGTNGLHPAEDGYYQIGDVFFRHLTHLLNLMNK